MDLSEPPQPRRVRGNPFPSKGVLVLEGLLPHLPRLLCAVARGGEITEASRSAYHHRGQAEHPQQHHRILAATGLKFLYDLAKSGKAIDRLVSLHFEVVF